MELTHNADLWTDEDECGKCGEPPDEEMAEVYDPHAPIEEQVSVVVHVSCIPDGWKLA